MATKIRANISTSNQYYIPKDRYYELKHFVMQYPDWKKEVNNLLCQTPTVLCREYYDPGNNSQFNSITEKIALKILEYEDKIKMVDKCIKSTDDVIGKYLLRGILMDLSYDKLNARTPIPCGRERYYLLYRKFFWLLDVARK